MDGFTLMIVLTATFAAFTLSASAGLGGSLILVPVLALVLGPKEGVALAALLLGGNNVLKMVAYRSYLPFRAAGVVVISLVIGAAVGASVLVVVPGEYVAIGIVGSFIVSLIAEKEGWSLSQKLSAPFLSFAAGATSGFSGTSGPLKGVALRNLRLDRRHLVGGASLASFAGDATKTAVFAEAGLITASSLQVMVLAVPLMVLGTLMGRRINHRIGETGYAMLFWSVMAGYSIRVVAVLF